MFLFKRKNGFYYVAYKDRAGKWRRKSTGERRKSEAMKFIQDSEFDDTRLKRITLSAFREEYLAYFTPRSKTKTVKTVRSCFNEFIRIAGDDYIAAITVQDIEHVIAVKLKTTSAYTARKIHQHLASAFETGVRWGYLKDNVFRKVKKPPKPEIQHRYLTVDEFNHFLKHVDDRGLWHFFRTAVLSGMRAGELRHLKREDVDFKTRVVNVVNRLGEFTTKTYQSRRIPMGEELYNALDSAMEFATYTHPDSPYVFCNPRGLVLNESTVSKEFKKYIKLSELNPKLRLHDLRHTFGSWLVINGVDLYRVAKLMGHADIQSTQRYAHLKAETLHDDIDKIRLFDRVLVGFS